MSPRLLTIFLCLLSFSLVATRGEAQVIAYTWSGNSTNNGAVTDGTNWGGTAPTGIGGLENLVFDASGAQTNVLFPIFTSASLTFGSARPAYTLSGTGGTPVLTLSAASGVTVAAGNTVTFASSLGLNLAAGLLTGDDHTFNIAAATTLQINGIVTGTGHFSKTGAGTLVLTGANTFNYNGGLGFLNSSSIHAGTVLLDGGAINHGTSGDIWVGENNGDNGTLTITNGGTASGYYGVLGNISGSTGTATISGNTSSWSVSNGMSVGSGGTGTLTLANGGKVNIVSGAGTLNVGATSGSTGTLNIGGTAAGAAAAGGIVNAATITTANGATGTLQFNTTATSGTPYYLTKDGTSGGAAIAVTGATKVINTDGYNVLTGTNTYSSGTVVTGGTLKVTGSVSHSATDTIVNGLGSTPTLLITSGGDLTNDRLRIGVTGTSYSGAVTVDGSGSTLTNTTYMYVGEAGTGTLTISNGGTVTSPNTSIGNNAGGVGTVTVTGSGSTLTNTSTLYVGAAGDGTLTVSNGGTATNLTGVVGNNPGGFGEVSVDGSGSTWTNTGVLTVGAVSDGYVAAFNSGSITAASATVGGLAGVYGDLAVYSSGTFSTTGNLIVGNNGYGTLSFGIGSVTTGGQAILANNSGSTGSVYLDNSGSLWTVGSDLYIGNAGTGSMRATGSSVLNVGGVAGTGTIHLGHTGGSGSLQIGYDGEGYNPGSVINASSITTGTGTGTLLFGTSAAKGTPYYFTKDGSSGGTFVTITGATQVQQVAGYNVLGGTSTYTGGTTISGGTLVAATTGALGTGTVQLNGGSLSVSPGVTVGNALTFTVGGGTLGGNGTFSAPATIGTNARVSPGNSVGTLTFSGGLTMASGGAYDLEVQAAGGAAGTGYDLLSISGAPLDITATSGSPFTLRLISLNGAGALGNVSDFSSSNTYAWTIASSAAGITGFAADKFVVTTPNFTNSLGIGSFYVTQSGNDLILNFTPVPEPSTYALLAAGLVLAGLSRRRRQS